MRQAMRQSTRKPTTGSAMWGMRAVRTVCIFLSLEALRTVLRAGEVSAARSACVEEEEERGREEHAGTGRRRPCSEGGDSDLRAEKQFHIALFRCLCRGSFI
jgi:hypothetical protein